MNGTTPNSTVRELDSRTSDGIGVRLLWNPLTDSVSVSVDDRRYGESFRFDVPRAHALEAFRHPFGYVGTDYDPPAEPLEHVPASQSRGKDGR